MVTSNDNQVVQEETNPSPPTERISKHPPRECENPLCKKVFTPFNSRAKYCSPQCNATASKIRLANQVPQTPVQENQVSQPAKESKYFSYNSLNGLDGPFAIPPHAIMMITHHEKEAERWEKKYNEEVAEHKKTRELLDGKKEELRDRDNKPSVLNGLVETVQSDPSILKELFGTIRALIPNRGNAPGASPALTQAQASETLSGVENETVRTFSTWFLSLGPETQQAVWTMLQTLSQIGDEEKMMYVIQATLQQWQQV